MRKLNTLLTLLLIVFTIVVLCTYAQAAPRKVIVVPFWSGYDISIHPDGKVISSASLQKIIHLIDIETGEEIKVLEGHTEGVASIGYGPNGDILVSGDQAGFNIIWNTETNEQVNNLAKHTWVIKDIVFSPNGKILATGDWGWDNTLRLWNTETWELLYGKVAGKVDDISFSFDGSAIAAGVLDTGLVNIWETETGDLLHTLDTGMEHVLAVTFIGTERKLVCGGSVGLQLWDGETGEKISDFPEEGITEVRSADINPDRRLLAVGRADGMVQLWDMKSVTLIETLELHFGRSHTVTFSRDGLTLATAANEVRIGVWDVEPFSEPVLSVNPKGKVSVLWGAIKSR